jgi:hypothetical protein
LMRHEEGLRWIRANACGSGNNCIEVAAASEDIVLLRDSRDREGPVLRVSRTDWEAFLEGARGGDFDALA